jgi:glycosyltransferase involved in cell wall biosynthesis
MVTDAAQKYEFVRYHGNIENSFVPAVLMKNDLLISTAKWETLPYNILEAQAAGLPAVAFDIPGPGDIIIDGKTGILAESEDDFALAVADIIMKRKTFDKEAIKDNITGKFEPSLIYDKIAAMLRDYSAPSRRTAVRAP